MVHKFNSPLYVLGFLQYRPPKFLTTTNQSKLCHAAASNIFLHYMAVHCTVMHCMTLPYTTLHCISSHIKYIPFGNAIWFHIPFHSINIRSIILLGITDYGKYIKVKNEAWDPDTMHMREFTSLFSTGLHPQNTMLQLLWNKSMCLILILPLTVTNKTRIGIEHQTS